MVASYREQVMARLLGERIHALVPDGLIDAYVLMVDPSSSVRGHVCSPTTAYDSPCDALT